MISTKKLIKMARKWQKIAAIRRKRISFSPTEIGKSMSPVAEKAHIAVYSADQRRLVLPIKYLNTYIFGELLKMSEEEFGLPGDGPITLPFDAVDIDQLLSLMKKKVGQDMEKAFIMSMAARRCLTYHQEHGVQQSPLVCSF